MSDKEIRDYLQKAQKLTKEGALIVIGALAGTPGFKEFGSLIEAVYALFVTTQLCETINQVGKGLQLELAVHSSNTKVGCNLPEQKRWLYG